MKLFKRKDKMDSKNNCCSCRSGIDVKVQVPPTCSGKIVEIDGKKYKLTEV